MFRLTLLGLVLAPLAQILPQGCPLGPPEQPLPTDRNIIATTATAPETATVGELVPLTATATADVDGGAVLYSWVQISGTGTKITYPMRASASFRAPSLPADQTLRFIVTTTNERGDVGLAEVEVLVQVDPNYGSSPAGEADAGPVARAGVDREVSAGSAVVLDGSNSRGDSLTYEWRQEGGTQVTLGNADTDHATFTAPDFDQAGDNEVEFELEVRDNRNRRDTDRIVLTVIEATDDTESHPRLRFETSMGDFVVELDRDNAPVSVANMLTYVEEDFYDGTIFHRVIADFVVQGGGFEPGLEQREPTQDPIINESDNGLLNERGTIAMARTSDPNSATSQFYINLIDNTSLDYTAGNPGYAVFGRVIEGMDVIDAIGAVQTGSQEGFNDVPDVDVILVDVIRIYQSVSGADG
ncbi:MAG: peptidylprolyl isomerase [Planctomycetota bacterium]